MDTAGRLRKAWEAVEAAALPEHLHEIAFREALALEAGSVRPQVRSGKDVRSNPAGKTPEPVEFFEKLAEESGISVENLQQVLAFNGETVTVAPPARSLGTTTTDQARNVAALVAGARFAALGENPVPSKAVREACAKKNCYAPKDFAKHLRPLRGFNLSGKGESAEILINARWIDEFTAAVVLVTGSTD